MYHLVKTHTSALALGGRGGFGKGPAAQHTYHYTYPLSLTREKSREQEKTEKNALKQVNLAKQTLIVGRGFIPIPTTHRVDFQHVTYLICIWINLAYFPIT